MPRWQTKRTGSFSIPAKFSASCHESGRAGPSPEKTTAILPFFFVFSLQHSFLQRANDTAAIILLNFRSYAVFVEAQWCARGLPRLLCLLALIAGAGAIASHSPGGGDSNTEVAATYPGAPVVQAIRGDVDGTLKVNRSLTFDAGSIVLSPVLMFCRVGALERTGPCARARS